MQAHVSQATFVFFIRKSIDLYLLVLLQSKRCCDSPKGLAPCAVSVLSRRVWVLKANVYVLVMIPRGVLQHEPKIAAFQWWVK